MLILSLLVTLWMLLRSPWHPQDDRGDPQRWLEEGGVGQDARGI